MKKYIFLFIASFVAILNAHASNNQMMCTMQYAPVCGSIQVQCIKAPCPPIRETYGNKCLAHAAWATNITSGECDTVPMIPPGWGSDIHGCKPSTGYIWNPLAKQCLRPWESQVRVMTIAPETKSCVFGILDAQCLQVRAGWKWSSLYGGISGFDFVSGYTYRLRVLETRIDNPPADGSAIEYSLLKVISTKSTISYIDEILIWDWRMIWFNDMSLVTLSNIQAENLTLSITKDRYSARICNAISGAYSIKNGAISSPFSMSTKMACPNTLISKIEELWSLDEATYSIAAARQVSGSMGPSIWLTITTKAGDRFTYTR